MTFKTQNHNLAVKKQSQEKKHKKACREKKGYPSMETALGDSCIQEGQSRAYKCGVCSQFHLARMTKGSSLRDLFSRIEQERADKSAS